MKRPLISVLLFLLVYNLIILSIVYFSDIKPEAYSIQSNRIVQYWSDSSISHTRFIPMNGNTGSYYLSHPPFSYYLLYAFEKWGGFHSYYILNAILVSISALFVYLTIALLLNKKAKSENSPYSWAGMILYLSAYPILKYQYFNYHPDIFVLPSLLIAQYVFLKLMMKERYRSVKYIFLISSLLFIMNYSSWFGVSFSLIIGLFGLVNLRRGYKLIPYILIAFFVSIMTVLFIYTQYAVFGGWKNVIYYFKDTYWRESPLYGHLRQTTLEIMFQIVKYLGVLILALAMIFTYSVFGKKRKFIFTKNGYRYLILSLLPVGVYSVLLIQYFQNNFACLYFVAPLVISITIWLEKIFRNENEYTNLLKILLLIILSNLSLFVVF